MKLVLFFLDFSLCYININAMNQRLKYNENKSPKLAAKILFNMNNKIIFTW